MSCQGLKPSSMRPRVAAPCITRLPIQSPLPASRGTAQRCRAAATAAATLDLHIGDTTISVPFSAEKGEKLKSAFTALLQTFAAKQKAERPKRWDMMEVKFKGTSPEDLELFEACCNPNAYPTAFDAKVLISIRTRDGVKVTTEPRLSAVKADLDAFLS